jgi:hypothetical protein
LKGCARSADRTRERLAASPSSPGLRRRHNPEHKERFLQPVQEQFNPLTPSLCRRRFFPENPERIFF